MGAVFRSALALALALVTWSIDASAIAQEASIAGEFRSNFKQAVAIYQPLAEQGNPSAQNDLASYLEFGGGTPSDFVQAIYWYRKAADQGLAIAQYNLAMMYERGSGTSVDYTQALIWLHRAADAGYGPAQHHLGGLYAQGRGVPKDLAEAVRWFREVAIRGGIEAQFYLGLAYAGGGGVPQDYVEAYKWYTIAASANLLPEAAKAAFLNSRAKIVSKMTSAQIADAEQRVHVWQPKSEEDRFVNSEWEGPGSPDAPLAIDLESRR
jgi:hypothetical protein